MKLHLPATGRHLPYHYGITHLLPDTSKHTPP